MRIYTHLDKLEDKVRGILSHSPLVYALIGGTAIVLFWGGSGTVRICLRQTAEYGRLFFRLPCQHF